MKLHLLLIYRTKEYLHNYKCTIYNDHNKVIRIILYYRYHPFKAPSAGQVFDTGVFSNSFGPSRSGRVFLGGARRAFRAPRSPAGRKPVPSPSSTPLFPPPASRTFRGYSRLRREITSIKNAQAHKMTLLRISSYHAAQNPCFPGKQPHNMSFYHNIVIICGANAQANLL